MKYMKYFLNFLNFLNFCFLYVSLQLSIILVISLQTSTKHRQLYYYIGGSRGRARRTPPPYGTQFFRFCIHFHQKVPMSEVHAPPNGCTPPLREILDPPLFVQSIQCAQNKIDVLYFHHMLIKRIKFQGFLF